MKTYPTTTTLADAKAAVDAADGPGQELDLTVARALGNAPDHARANGRDPEGPAVEWETPGFASAMAEAAEEPDVTARRAARRRVWDSGEAQGLADPVSVCKRDAAGLLPDYNSASDDWTISVTRFPPPDGWHVRAVRARSGAVYEATSGHADTSGALALLRVALAARLDASLDARRAEDAERA